MTKDDFDWEAAIAKLYKQYEGIPEDIIAELKYYKKRITILSFQLKQARFDQERSNRLQYEQGWKDATKKIKNFIIKHCEEYE